MTNTSTKTKNVTTHKEVPADILKKLATFETKSAKIRYLDSMNYSRSDISKIVGCIYQHVRNVLITPIQKPKENIK